MKKCFVLAAFCVCISAAGVSQSQNVTRNVSKALAAQTDGTLSDGGGVFVNLTASLQPNPGIPCPNDPVPNCLTVFLGDPLTGAFGATWQALGPTDFQFNTPKTLESAHFTATLQSDDPNFTGAYFDMTWAAPETPIMKSTTQQHQAAQGFVFHQSSNGSSRFATVTGTVIWPQVGPPGACCTWNGDGQIINNLTQTIQIVKP
jgi:hypothetical protein